MNSDFNNLSPLKIKFGSVEVEFAPEEYVYL